MTTHTPGPWTVGGVDEHIWIERPNKSDACICDLIQSGFDKDGSEPYYTKEDEANARLIAAAPDLLAALKAHDSYMADAGYSGPESDALHPKAAENWRRIRVAIAKAEGR